MSKGTYITSPEGIIDDLDVMIRINWRALMTEQVSQQKNLEDLRKEKTEAATNER